LVYWGSKKKKRGGKQKRERFKVWGGGTYVQDYLAGCRGQRKGKRGGNAGEGKKRESTKIPNIQQPRLGHPNKDLRRVCCNQGTGKPPKGYTLTYRNGGLGGER